MKGVVGAGLLGLGLVIAAASAARNGEQHARYRQTLAAVQAAEQADAVVRAGVRLNQQLRAEGIDVSPPTLDEALALLEKEPRLKAQVEATQQAVEALGKWGIGDGPPAEQLHLAERQRDAVGMPAPDERVRAWAAVGAPGWGVGIVLIVIGSLLARRGIAEQNAGTATAGVGRVDVPQALRGALEDAGRIAAELAELPMDTDAQPARAALDALVEVRLGAVVEARGQLIARHGIAGFAEYFGPLSSAERNLSRAWSAITDGHAVVARESVAQAQRDLQAALTAFEAVDGRKA